MNMVAVRHMGDSGKYLFQLPDGVQLDPGTTVLCETRRNPLEPGVCVTPSFEADPDVVCPLWGTQTAAMKRVIKVLREFSLEWPEEPERAVEDEDDDE